MLLRAADMHVLDCLIASRCVRLYPRLHFTMAACCLGGACCLVICKYLCFSNIHFTGQAFDGRADTHWFSRDGRCLNGRMAAHVWLEYCLPAQRGAVTLARYTLTSASGCAKNDPMVVILYGVRDAGCPSNLVL